MNSIAVPSRIAESPKPSLDVVRAEILYFAYDLDPIVPAAATLLRAAASAIEESLNAGEHFSGRALSSAKLGRRSPQR